MLTWLKELLYDRATFTQYFRALLAAIWMAYETGLLPDAVEGTFMWYASKALLVVAFLMRAGDKNQPNDPPARWMPRPPHPPRGVLPLLLGLVLGAGAAWAADVPGDQRVVTVSDTGVTVTIDYTGDGVADASDFLLLCNTGAAPVVCVQSAIIPTYSPTAKFPYAPGDCRSFDRSVRGPKFTHFSCRTGSGTSTTVGFEAAP